MANKKNVEQRVKEQREKELSQRKKRLRIYPLISLVITGILLLLMLTSWVSIYNTDISGNEIEVSGFQCVSAGLSDNYASTDTGAFGNMAVFSAFAESWVRSLSVVSAVLMFVLILHLLVLVFQLITNKQGAFTVIDIVLIVAEIGLFIASYAIALGVKDSGILVKYCKSNPACSVRSSAILPALFAILSVAAPILSILHARKIESQVTAEAALPAKAPVTLGKKRKKHR